MIQTLLSTLEQIYQADPRPVVLHEPRFTGREWQYVKECLDTGWVSSAGDYVTRFERQLAEFTGISHVVATVNGTAALHVALLATGVRPGDEVLTPGLTFVATANAVSYCGAVPHFIDSSPDTLGVDPEKLADYLTEIAERRGETCHNRHTGRRLAAVVAMHTLGHPVALEALAEVCERFSLSLVEDAAEALGSYYLGKHVGRWGRTAILSFNGNKIITTGGGGAVLTCDPRLARWLKHVTTTAKRPHPWRFYHDEVGYNYRLPNLNAALGCAQLEQLPEIIERKRALARRLQEAFAPLPGFEVFSELAGAASNYWLNLLHLPPELARDTALEALHDKGFLARPLWEPLHRLPMYRDCPRMDLSVADSLASHTICLPSAI